MNTCPRCLAEADHSPDEKACSDNCITRHMRTIAIFGKALNSIALNSCCGNCQEAALVARAALFESTGKPVGDTLVSPAPQPTEHQTLTLEPDEDGTNICPFCGQQVPRIHTCTATELRPKVVSPAPETPVGLRFDGTVHTSQGTNQEVMAPPPPAALETVTIQAADIPALEAALWKRRLERAWPAPPPPAVDLKSLAQQVDQIQRNCITSPGEDGVLAVLRGLIAEVEHLRGRLQALAPESNT